MQKATSPWIWTLLVSTLAAVLVAGAGVALSRRVDRLAEKPPGNRVDDAFRETARRIGSDLPVRVGKPIPFCEIEHLADRDEMVAELRKRTYALAQPSDIQGDATNLHLRTGRIKGWKNDKE